MAFLIFERTIQNGSPVLRPTGEGFRLAGYNLIYQAWVKRARPMEQGWQVSAAELIELHSGGQHSYNTRRLIIDFDPNARWRIGLIELLDVYAFTHRSDSGEPSWTPLMLRLRDIFYKEYDPESPEEEKPNIINNIPEPKGEADFVEFLYLNGANKGWNWGKNGMTNAVFLQGDARAYFRQFF